MKTRNKIGVMKRVLSLVMAMVFVLAMPLTVEAKVKTVKPVAHKFATRASELEPISTEISKGTHNVVVKKTEGVFCEGYVKFVAPESRTYTITVSNIKAKGAKSCLGSLFGQTRPVNSDSDVLDFAYFDTKGKEHNWLNVGSRKYKNYLAKRTGKVTLEAGQTLYLQLSLVASKKTKSASARIKIK
ncbi:MULTISPECIES: hypothetical protein [unclassified Butyrivibrio]|uniref:hypothetical protein n=1 Tax=unclassified Butyrivibrio TaxID=2639466 RepID=UPI0003B51D4B|nr:MULTISPECIES: hypothetical protein [unclassified Butyrivibrio]